MRKVFEVLIFSWRRIKEGFNLKVGFRSVKIVFVDIERHSGDGCSWRKVGVDIFREGSSREFVKNRV